MDSRISDGRAADDGTTGQGLAQEPPVRPVTSAALPLHDPLWTYVLLGANVLVWLAMGLQGGSENLQVLIRFGAKVNPLIASGEYWRLVTPMFLHIGLPHLAFNAYALLIFGRDVERLFGRARFVVLYALAGLAGSVASFLGSEAISAGASGAIFGLVGATLVYFSTYRNNLGPWGRQRLTSLLLVAGFNLVWGFVGQGIDNLGHIGGLLGGLLLGWAYCPRYRVEYPTTPLEPPRMRDAYSARRAVAISVGLLVALGGLAGLGVAYWRNVYAGLPGF